MIHLEPVREWTLRAYDDPDGYERKLPFRVVGRVLGLARAAVVSALHGQVTGRDVYDFYLALQGQGFEQLYAKREHRHGLPGGRLIEEGPFRGWERVDLKTQCARLGRRYRREEDNEIEID